MTQPSINMTFDTSLVDTQNPNASFSTTESESSVTHALSTSANIEQIDFPHTPLLKTSTSVKHLPTQAAYDSWASVYDTDGNMLQAIDDVELSTVLPKFMELVDAPLMKGKLQLLDLGCGTGRNTAKLMSYTRIPGHSQVIEVTALDFSAGMLEVAKGKLAPLEKDHVKLRLRQADCFPTVENKNASPLPAVDNLTAMDGAISTLVLEHVPLGDYFATLAILVRKGGHALVTNMHSDMGNMSQAGFVNAEGVKVRGASFAYTPEDTVEAAVKAGFEVISLKERMMTREDVESGKVGERGLKWVGLRVWYGIMLRRL